MINLIIMSMVWLTSSFTYYLVLTLTNTFEHVYISGLVGSFSEVVAYIVSGLFYDRIGVKLSLVLSFGISTVGGILILAWGLQHQSSTLFFIMFLFAKFGITCSINICYAANSYFFPTLFAATAMGICNFLARLVSASSYIISQLEEPVPMILFTGLCILTFIASFFLQTANESTEPKVNVVEVDEIKEVTEGKFRKVKTSET